jgi:hypothetical protein
MDQLQIWSLVFSIYLSEAEIKKVRSCWGLCGGSKKSRRVTFQERRFGSKTSNIDLHAPLINEVDSQPSSIFAGNRTREGKSFETLRSNTGLEVPVDMENVDFRARYPDSEDKGILALKAAFHLINNLLIGVCHLYLQHMEKEREGAVEGEERSFASESQERYTTSFHPGEFTEEHIEKCIYEAEGSQLTVIEHAPAIFKRIRK